MLEHLGYQFPISMLWFHNVIVSVGQTFPIVDNGQCQLNGYYGISHRVAEDKSFFIFLVTSSVQGEHHKQLSSHRVTLNPKFSAIYPGRVDISATTLIARTMFLLSHLYELLVMYLYDLHYTEISDRYFNDTWGTTDGLLVTGNADATHPLL